MVLFVSHRERRLWLWTLAVVVAILSTLGLARTLAEELRNRELLDSAFFVAFLMTIAAVVVLALRTRPGGVEIGIWIGVAAVYLMAFLRLAIPEERTHLVEYGVLGVLIYEALRERAAQGRQVPAPALLAILVASLLGLLDEIVQAVLPNRVFDVRDILFNLGSAAVAVLARGLLERARRWDSRRRSLRRTP